MKFNNIYVLCPANLVTGGTEALHQLVDAINRLGGNAYIVYTNGLEIGIKAIVPKKFRNYYIKTSTKILNEVCNALVVPETKTQPIKEYSKITKFIWWLSVDYFNGALDVYEDQSISHLFQSEYAREHLVLNRVSNYFSLSDYIKVNEIKPRVKDMLIVMPGRKIDQRYQFLVDQIRRKFDVKIIKNLCPKGLALLFSRSKLYIDFGFFPGKDRLPREAILFDNKILLSSVGAARNRVDFMVDKKFKIPPSANVNELINLIENLLDNRNCEQDSKAIKTTILNEKRVFFQEVKFLFLDDEVNQYYWIVRRVFAYFIIYLNLIFFKTSLIINKLIK